MITGRGPGAPSVTPDMVLTLRDAAQDQAVDLTAIRHTDVLIDLLGSRRLRRPHTSGDPALILLSSLAADVDRPAEKELAVPELAGAAVSATAERAAGERAVAGEWVRATAAAAVIATAVTVLAVAGLLLAGVLVRLTGMPARLWFGRPGGPARRTLPDPLAGQESRRLTGRPID